MMNDVTPTSRAPVAAPAAAPHSRLGTFVHALLFVLGFSTVFVIGWGGAVTALGRLFFDYQRYLALVGGVVVILFGLATLRVIRIPWMYYDTRPQWSGQGARQGGLVSSALMGVFFAAGWTPCVGTTLGAILTLGLSQNTAGQAMVLSSGYALGLGVPFLLIGLGLGRATDLVRRFRKHLRTIEIINGLFLITIGVMMLTNTMTWIASWALRSGLYLDVPFGGASAPSYTVAVIAGLLSFLSPCVLPLVPAYVGYLGGHVIGSAQPAGPAG
jgi:cytochrome c-type biogenesis protein